MGSAYPRGAAPIALSMHTVGPSLVDGAEVTDPYAPQPYVPQGYLPPADAYQPQGIVGDDPLINPPNSGINGWFTRIGGIFQRSWKSMTAIFAITHLLPGLVIAVGGAVFGTVLAVRIVNTQRDGSQELLA